VHNMRQRCMEQPQRIVLPEVNDHRILAAAAASHGKGFAHIILLGKPDLVKQVCALTMAHRPLCSCMLVSNLSIALCVCAGGDETRIPAGRGDDC
jgi:Phosphate acetyl/butaryl transferase